MSGSGISWAICKSASRSRQITTPASHHSVFYWPGALLPPNQQRQSTAGILKTEVKLYCNSAGDATVSSGPIRYALSDCPALIMPHRMQDTRIVADVAYLASCVCLSVGHNRDSCKNGSVDRYFVWNVGPKNHVG